MIDHKAAMGRANALIAAGGWPDDMNLAAAYLERDKQYKKLRELVKAWLDGEGKGDYFTLRAAIED